MSRTGKGSLLLYQCWSPGHAGILKCAHPLGSIKNKNETKTNKQCNFVFKIWNKVKRMNNKSWQRCSLVPIKRMVYNTGSYSGKSVFFAKKNKNPVTYCNYLHLRDIKTTRTLTMIYTCMTIVIQSNLNEFSDETQTVFHCYVTGRPGNWDTCSNHKPLENP